MAKKLRASHGGTLNPEKLSPEETFALNSVLGIFTDKERQDFDNYHIKYMLTPKAKGLKSDDKKESEEQEEQKEQSDPEQKNDQQDEQQEEQDEEQDEQEEKTEQQVLKKLELSAKTIKG